MRARLIRELVEFGRTIRLSHTLFALPFALGTAFLAEPPCPAPAALALVVACMVTARTAAMGMNRVADARLDAANPRTAGWAIPAGRLRRGTALALALASAALFVACAAGFYVLRGNPWPVLLAPAFLAVVLGYSWAKRFTVLSHWALGLALGLAPVGVWVALRGRIDLAPCLLGAAIMFWTAGFDILYAMQDEAFDRQAGLHSLPALLGGSRARRVALGSHLVTLLFLMAAYAAMGPKAAEPRMGLASLIALAVVGVALAVQHVSAAGGPSRRGRVAEAPAEAGDEKGDGNLLSAAPFGPSGQKVPVPFLVPPQSGPERTAAAFLPLNAAVSLAWMAGAMADALAGGWR